MIRYIYIVTVTAGLFMTISQQLCGRGEYLHTPNSGPDVCLPCGSETFMSEDNHVNRKCYNCTRIQTPDLEILTKSCNRTHDSVIACKEGYFRTNETCLPCRKCNFTARQCQNYSDAICCPGKNYVVSGNSCALVCEPGQYLNKSSKECFHCPNGTFRSEINHIFSKCNKCTTAEKFGNEVLKQPCNSTHDAVIRCREGYFWKYSVVPGKKGECDICSICIQTSIGRNCTETNNTICCQEADMDVVEEPSGHKCIKKAVNSTTSPGNTILLLLSLLMLLLLLLLLYFSRTVNFRTICERDLMKILQRAYHTGRGESCQVSFNFRSLPYKQASLQAPPPV